jgi:hypothetical protein
MRSNSLPLFLLLSVAGLLCLMPIWYFFLAPWLAAPVFYLAGEAVSNAFHWVVTYERTGSKGTLLTSLQFIAEQGQGRTGKLAPVADYRMHGYGLVMLWAMLLASRPAALWRKLFLGTGVMLFIAASGVTLQWLNDIFNRSGPHVLAQTRASAVLAEAVEFGFHFNLFVFTALAPLLLWVVMNRAFVQALWNDAIKAPAPAGQSDETGQAD